MTRRRRSDPTRIARETDEANRVLRMPLPVGAVLADGDAGLATEVGEHDNGLPRDHPDVSCTGDDERAAIDQRATRWQHREGGEAGAAVQHGQRVEAVVD